MSFTPAFRAPVALVRTGLRITCVALMSIAFAVAANAATVHQVVLGAGYAAASSMTPTTAQASAGSGSWSKLLPGPKAETYISPDATFGRSLLLSDITSVTYHTRNHAAAAPLEFYLAIYTRGAGSPPYAHGFYEQRLNAEPYLKTVQPYVQSFDVWNAWSTGGADPLTFTDHNNAGNAGFYGAPTLAQLLASPINWSTWPTNPTGGSANPSPIAYAAQRILYLSFQTGSGWSLFDGYIDDITVTLSDGDSYVIDLESTVDPLYVDDDWAAAGVGSEVAPGKFIGYNAFAKVQDAVTAAIPNGTINVAAGTYTEQVTVNGKNVKILGAGRASCVIKAPATLATKFTTSGPNKPVFTALNAANVELRDVTVDGNGVGNANNRIQGIGFWNAGGKVLGCDVLRVRSTPLDGVQAGVGIFGGNNAGTFALEVGDTRVLDFQKNGTVFTGAGYAVNIHDCTITGAGATGLTAQNGIQISFGADGTVTNCAVSGTYYTGPTFTATGQLFFDAGTVNVTGGSVTDCQTGTYYIDTDGQMLGTSTSSSVGLGIGTWGVATYNSAASFAAEARTGSDAHARPVAQPFDDVGAAFARTSTNATSSLFTVTLDGGCMTGPGTPASEGVEAYTEGGGMLVNVNHVEISNWGYGILADGTAGGPTVNAHDNAITGNVTQGYFGGLGAHNADLNWWGNLGGPGAGGANGVAGAVDFTPWRVTGTDTNPGCGFAPPPNNAITPIAPVACVTPSNPCVDVPVTISRTSSDGLRGFSIDVQLSAGLTLCAATDEGSYLSDIGGTQFQVLSNGGGSYTIDCSILGLPCGATALSGTLFTLHVGSLLPSATGTVTVTAVTLRDCANGGVAASAGAPASISIDNTAPVAIAVLSATQRRTGNDADGTTKIDLAWPAVEAGASVLVYRKGFGFYPEYDDAGGAAPATPSYPPAGWTLAATVTGPTVYADETTARDFYYYVAFVRDACGNVSAVSNRTNGTLNYELGDVQPVAGLFRGNNLVNTPDVSDLGIHYGITLVLNDVFNYLDVGPTTDFSVNARPTTDNRVQFEDLMMFAINYGQVSAPAAVVRPVGKQGRERLELRVPELPAVGETFAVRLVLSSPGTVKGVSVQLAYDAAVVEPLGVEAGELLTGQHVPSVVLSSAPGNVDAALLGTGEAIIGEGELASAVFRVKATGDAAIQVGTLLARDRDNKALALGTISTPAGNVLPGRTALGPAFPNPFHGETTIELALRHEANVSLDVFDLSGRRVASVLHGVQPAGLRLVKWDGRGDRGVRLSPGIYLMRLEADGQRQSRRVLLIP